MHEDYKRKEEKELITRFEAFLKSGEGFYFDEESFSRIISYYAEHEKMVSTLVN